MNKRTQHRNGLMAPILMLIAACGETGGEKADSSGRAAGGTIVIASMGEAEHLMPPVLASLAAKQVVDQLFSPLAEVGPSMNTLGDADFVPRAAARWNWSADSTTVDFVMRPGARFHDGHAVTAGDVKFTYALYADAAVGSPHFSAFPKIDSVSIVDSMVVRVYFAERSPERFFKFATNLLVLPKHLLDTLPRSTLAESKLASEPVGSGPYRFVRWERGVRLELASDTANAEGRPGPDRLIWQVVSDPNAAARSVVAGEADFSEMARPEGMAMLTPDVPVRAAEYAAPQVGYLLFNMRSRAARTSPHPIFGGRDLRRALAMAIDRSGVVRNALDTLAVVARGPFPRSVWSADTTIPQLGFDRNAANQALEAAGWRDTNGDGVREKGGTALRFSLLVPSVSATRRQMATVLQEQLKAVGADAQVEAVEPSVLLPRLAKGDFDAFIHVWQTDPSPSTVAQAWGGSDLGRSANYGWYANSRVDSIIARAVVESSIERAKPLYRDAYTEIVQDAPAVFLWEPRTFALAHKRIRLGTLRGDAWWSGIRTWQIPVAERIARDGVGGA